MMGNNRGGEYYQKDGSFNMDESSLLNAFYCTPAYGHLISIFIFPAFPDHNIFTFIMYFFERKFSIKFPSLFRDHILIAIWKDSPFCLHLHIHLLKHQFVDWGVYKKYLGEFIRLGRLFDRRHLIDNLWYTYFFIDVFFGGLLILLKHPLVDLLLFLVNHCHLWTDVSQVLQQLLRKKSINICSVMLTYNIVYPV